MMTVGARRQHGVELLAGGALGLATVSDSFVFLTLQRQLGFGASYFPLLYAGVAACTGLLAVPIGRTADRLGRWRTFLAGHGLLLLVYVVLVGPGPGTLRLTSALLLFGTYYAATDGVLAAMASAALPPRLCGSGLAVLSTVTNVARLLASVAFGAMWMWTSLNSAIVAFGVALVIAIVIARLALRPADVPIDRPAL